MKILLIVFLTYTLQAGTLGVKQLFNFKTVSVQKQEMAVSHIFYGETALDESRVRDITLRFDAFVTKLYADKSYLHVSTGEPLFSFYAKEVTSVMEELVLGRRYSRQARENAALKLKLLDLPKLANAKKVLYDVKYPSPVDGYIIQKDVIEGDFVKKGKMLMQIADFSSLWVIAKVYQKDIAKIQKGMHASIKVAGFAPVEGKVDFIYPKVNAKDQSIPVRIALKNTAKMFPGLFAKIRLQNSARIRLLLPKSAVLQKGGKTYVFIPGSDGTFNPLEINASRLNSRYFEIKEGLKEGDKVVDKALFLLDSDAMTNGLYDIGEDEDW